MKTPFVRLIVALALVLYSGNILSAQWGGILSTTRSSTAAPIALLTHTVAASANTNNITTSAIDTSGATLLVISVSSLGSLAAPTITDSKSNTWTARTSYTGNSTFKTTIFYAANPTVGTSHTFTATLTASFPAIAVAAFSGVAATSPYDVENGGTTAGATSLATGSVTPSNNNELVVTGLNNGDTGTFSVNSSFTITDQLPFLNSVHFAAALAYKIQTTATAVNPTWSWSSSSGAAAPIATFKQAP